MTVQELIDLLMEIEDKSLPIYMESGGNLYTSHVVPEISRVDKRPRSVDDPGTYPSYIIS